MKKTLSALLLLSTIMASHVSAAEGDSADGSTEPGGLSAGNGLKLDTKKIGRKNKKQEGGSETGPAGGGNGHAADSKIAKIKVTAIRGASAELDISSGQATQFDASSITEEKTVAFTIKSNLESVTVELSPEKGYLAHSDEKESYRIDYKISWVSAEARLASGVKLQPMSEVIQKASFGNPGEVKISIVEKDYDGAPVGRYADTITLTVRASS